MEGEREGGGMESDGNRAVDVYKHPGWGEREMKMFRDY